jgi:hypothetical protein
MRDSVSSAAVVEGSIGEAPSTSEEAFQETITAFREASETLHVQDDHISSLLEASNAEQELLSIGLDFLSAQIDVEEGMGEALRRGLTTIMDNVRRRMQIIRTEIRVLSTSRTVLQRDLETAAQGMASTILGPNGGFLEEI